MVINALDIQIYLGDLFDRCEDEHDVDWLAGQLIDMVDCMAEETIEEMEE